MRQAFLAVILAMILAGSWVVGTAAQGVPSAPGALPPDLRNQPIPVTPESWILAYSMMGQTRAVIDLLARGVSPDARDESGGWTPLMMAAAGDFEALVKVLLDAGAHPDLRQRDGETALMVAALAGAQHVAAALIGRADINARDIIGNSALSYAALNGNTGIVTMLLKAGARADTADTEGETPLHHAAREGHLASVDALLTARIGRDARDKQGRTPLFDAASNGYGDVARRLLETGAAPDAADDTGRTPLMWSVLWDDPTSVAALLDRGARIDRRAGEFDSEVTALILAAWTGKENIVKLLLARGADPDVTDVNGETALHWAASVNRVAVLRLLLDGRADPGIRNRSGQTALDVARYEERPDAVKLLETRSRR